MRSYPTNSPEAAARIVALVLLADGHVDRDELNALAWQVLHPDWDGQAAPWEHLLQTLCEDLHQATDMQWMGGAMIDDITLGHLLAEVQDPVLRCKVLRLCLQAVHADGVVTEAESGLLARAFAQWGLQRGAVEPDCVAADLAPARPQAALLGARP
jgi:uncharacterized tellurite resistance protein B-like protein